MRNWSVRWKVGSLVLLSVLLGVALGGTALLSMSKLAKSATTQDEYRKVNVLLGKTEHQRGKCRQLRQREPRLPDANQDVHRRRRRI